MQLIRNKNTSGELPERETYADLAVRWMTEKKAKEEAFKNSDVKHTDFDYDDLIRSPMTEMFQRALHIVAVTEITHDNDYQRL